ncbi:hypothetical protein [Nostoc sp.]|uniref:hypothetical protein n=1 Tax=Nostoc sp. TaxID=1180 RepID=UPI002FFC3B0F
MKIKKTTPAFAATKINMAIAGSTARAMLNPALFKVMAAIDRQTKSYGADSKQRLS